jgi:integrase
MLDTCCRPGELLSLQWQDVDLEQRLMTIRAENTKTGRGRVLPISTRLLAVLQMRRLDPSGNKFGPEAYVFGDELGRRAKSVRAMWERAIPKPCKQLASGRPARPPGRPPPERYPRVLSLSFPDT